MQFILGDFNDNGTMNWLHYDWLEQYTATDEQVNELNKAFKSYNWKFRVGGFKHYGGAQCTGKVLRHLVTKQVNSI